MKKIYLDYAATTPVDPEVMETMKPYFSERFGNASSLHGIGQGAKIALEDSRVKVSRLMGAKPEEIVFTSGGTESNNLAIKGISSSNRGKGRHIITSSIEHHCVLDSCKWLERNGFKVTYVPVNKEGLIDPGEIEKAIRKDTILVSIMHANNEIGTIQPIKEIGKICREGGIYFHTDAAQSFGKIPISVKKMNIDMLTANAHKMYGPKGVGCLYIREGVRIEPILHGGGHENGLRSGTENVSGIVGFGKACELAGKSMSRESERLTSLRDKLIKGSLKIPNSWLNGHPRKRLPNNVNLGFSYIEGEAMVLRLDMEGIEVSTGSACSSKSLEPSHVLKAIGLSHVQAHGSLRMTLGKNTKKEDIGYVLRVLPRVVESLREISPLGRRR